MKATVRGGLCGAVFMIGGIGAAHADVWSTCTGMSYRYYSVHLTAAASGSNPTDAVATIDTQAPASSDARKGGTKKSGVKMHGLKHNVQINIASLTSPPNFFELQYPTTGCTFVLATSNGESETWIFSNPGATSFQISSSASSTVTPSMSGTAYGLAP